MEARQMQSWRLLPGVILALLIMVGADGSFSVVRAQQDANPIKVGILHSFSGDMAISETSLKDVVRMLIQRQNKQGGLLGRPLVPVVMDPMSDSVAAAEMARRMIEEERVSVIFGCWTSDCRRAVRPVVEELNGLLFYPVQYEGQESSRNVIYTGATPNQQAIPAVDYLIGHHAVERWVLLGSDYVYPRITNSIVSAYLNERKGVSIKDLLVRYTSLDETDWGDVIAEIKAFASEGKKTAVISTVNGEANLFFYLALMRAGIRSEDIPVMAFSVGEEELAGIDTTLLAGHLATWSYFMSIDNAFNRAFINQWQKFAQNPRRVTKDPMEAHFLGFSFWAKAVEAARTTQPDAVLDKIIGLAADNLSGRKVTVLANHHLAKPTFIGKIEKDGQFEVVWESPELIAADPWSDHSSGTRNFTADWEPPISCGKFNMVAQVCEDVRRPQQAGQ
jgi:urea transport system substrate-binding protein